MNGKRGLITVALLVCITGAGAAESEAVNLHDAWIAEGPPMVKRHAGYVEIDNSGPTDVTLKEVTSPDFGRIEIHRSVIDNGIAKMLYQRSVTIPANGHLSFAPGGYHLMLLNAHKPLTEGASVSLTFTFNNGDIIHTEAKIKKLQNAAIPSND